MNKKNQKFDDVQHSAHYNSGNIECIDAIQSALGITGFVDFCRGNAIKYLWRCKLKNNFEDDIQKAKWYIDKIIDTLEN